MLNLDVQSVVLIEPSEGKKCLFFLPCVIPNVYNVNLCILRISSTDTFLCPDIFMGNSFCSCFRPLDIIYNTQSLSTGIWNDYSGEDGNQSGHLHTPPKEDSGRPAAQHWGGGERGECWGEHKQIKSSVSFGWWEL